MDFILKVTGQLEQSCGSANYCDGVKGWSAGKRPGRWKLMRNWTGSGQPGVFLREKVRIQCPGVGGDGGRRTGQMKS